MIYIDFDNVIYKCDKRLEDIIGEPLKHFDLVEHGLTKEVFSRPDFYLKDNKYLVDGAFEALSLLNINFPDVKILTKFVNPIEHKYKREFMDWLGFKDIEIIFVPIDGNKQDYLNDGDFLIDDDVRNLVESPTNVLFDYHGTFSYEWNKSDKDLVKHINWNDVIFYILIQMLIEQSKKNPSMDEMLEM